MPLNSIAFPRIFGSGTEVMKLISFLDVARVEGEGIDNLLKLEFSMAVSQSRTPHSSITLDG